MLTAAAGAVTVLPGRGAGSRGKFFRLHSLLHIAHLIRDGVPQSIRLFRVKGTTHPMQLVIAYNILLASSIDISILPHVLDVLRAGNTARYSPRQTSCAMLYASELLILRRAVAVVVFVDFVVFAGVVAGVADVAAVFAGVIFAVVLTIITRFAVPCSRPSTTISCATFRSV